MSRQTMAVCALVLLVAGSASAARFTDPFDTPPEVAGRKPFAWDGLSTAGAGPWRVVDGVLRYQTREALPAGASLSLVAAGLEVTDTTSWSLETGFRHVAGTAPRPGYETVMYMTWNAGPAQMRILGLLYDADKQVLQLLNGAATESKLPVDLTGEFHAVRLTATAEQVRLYIDDKLLAGPLPINAQTYSQTPGFFIGPITGGDKHTLHYEYSYFAFTTDGAFAPDAQPGWSPRTETQPVAEGLRNMQRTVGQTSYAGIRLVSREKGTARWQQVIPEHWRALADIIRKEPAQIEATEYTYPDATGPSKQNIYRNSQALRHDDKRCIAISHLTRGIDDTGPGFIDYKLWTRISMDGGKTYDRERPLVQTGPDFSPMHPLKYVWIGRNSFCYAAIPPFLKMSNGQVLLPIYFAPLDENGKYYNPLGAYTFTWVAALIGTWNAQGTDLTWEVSDDVRLSGEQSSRGSNECAVIELTAPGHLLLIMRGSNLPNPRGTLPACKWKALSTDYGRTWTECTPLTYSDGEAFYSPSSCSSMIRSSRTQKVYWIGNISRTLPRGNSPRFPLVIAEVDEGALALRRETVTIIDDFEPGDAPDMQLSNFSLLEDPATGQIIITLNRMMSPQHDAKAATGAHTYVVEVK